MKIVFFTTAHNSLSQRAYVELVDRGHTVIVVIASSEDVMLEAVEREHPDLIVAPMLKKVIPASILQAGAEMDAGDIWASRTFSMRGRSKSHLYRHEVTEAAIQGLLETIAKFES